MCKAHEVCTGIYVYKWREGLDNMSLCEGGERLDTWQVESNWRSGRSNIWQLESEWSWGGDKNLTIWVCMKVGWGLDPWKADSVWRWGGGLTLTGWVLLVGQRAPPTVWVHGSFTFLTGGVATAVLYHHLDQLQSKFNSVYMSHIRSPCEFNRSSEWTIAGDRNN